MMLWTLLWILMGTPAVIVVVASVYLVGCGKKRRRVERRRQWEPAGTWRFPRDD